MINLKVRYRLRARVPSWAQCSTIIHLRVAVIPQLRHARRGNLRGFRVDTDVIEDLPDLHAIGDKYDLEHLSIFWWRPKQQA
jgi:hypothetical protein